MAGFQVANFSFGKNIKDDERQRMQIAAQAATARRGQDINAAQADANRMEGARQFDKRMAQQQSAQEEGARQFDEKMGADRERIAEGARQFDKTQAFKEREYADKRGDVKRAQSWDEAVKLQQMEKEELEFQIRNAELERILAIRQKEDEERAHQKELMESAYGNAVIATELGGGFLTQKQVADFNERNGTTYNYVGKIDPTTGKPFSDNRIHFLEYTLDDKGQPVIDQESGRPMLNLDNPIPNEFYVRTMDGYFGKYNNRLSGGGMSEERMQLERDRIAQRQQEEKGRNVRAGAKGDAANARLAASIARNMNDIKRGLGLTNEQAASFQTSLTKILSDAFNPQDDADSNRPLTSSPYENKSGGAGKDGKTYEVIRSSTGAVIGKREVKSDGAAAQLQTTATPDSGGENGTGRQEPPNGQYKVKKDGISYHWGKSKSGKWGYFPDK